MIPRIFFIGFLIFSCHNGFGEVEALFVGGPNAKTLTIDRIYPFPGNRSPRFAFCCNQGKTVIIYDGTSTQIRSQTKPGKGNEKKIQKTTVFMPPYDRMAMNTSPLHFVTFCWDMKGNNDFVVIYEAKDKTRVFYGSAHHLQETPQILSHAKQITGKAVSFNYYDGNLSYIDLKSGHVYQLKKGGTSPRLLYRKPREPLSIKYYTAAPNRPRMPYFVLRNTLTNNSGIYKGNHFKKVVDQPHQDELYPHLPGNGTLLGYIRREPKEGQAVICLKTPQGTRTSRKSFALEENALLHQYPHMHFIDDSLYYFIAIPDIFAIKSPPGLTLLSKQREEENIWLPRGEIFLYEKNGWNECFNLYSNTPHTYNRAKNIRSQDIIPYVYKKQLHFLALSRVKCSIKKKDDNSWDGVVDTAVLSPDKDWTMDVLRRKK